MPIHLNIVDLSFVLIALAFLTSVGLYAIPAEISSSSFFYSSKKNHWMTIGTSIFSAQIFSILFWGFAVNHYMILFLLITLIFAGMLVRVFLTQQTASLPSLFERLYGNFSRIFIASFVIISSFLFRILLPLVIGSFLVNKLYGFDFIISGLVLLMLAGVYSISGGLHVIVRVEKWQTILLFSSIIMIAIISVREFGNINKLDQFLLANLDSFTQPSLNDGSSFIALILGTPILAIGYFCTEQHFLQRAATQNKKVIINRGIVFSVFLTTIFILILISPSWLVQFNQSPNLFTNSFLFYAFSATLGNFVGLNGLIMVVFFIVLLSILASSLNSISSILTDHFYRRFNPRASEKQLVLVGRLFSTALAVLSIFCIPFIRFWNSSLINSLVVIYFSLASPILAIFILGITTSRVNHIGANIALIVGVLLGMARIVIGFMSENGSLGGGLFTKIESVNIFYFGFALFIVSATVHFLISLIVNRYYVKPI
jgi:solute:Na+ symporter, SSS family